MQKNSFYVTAIIKENFTKFQSSRALLDSFFGCLSIQICTEIDLSILSNYCFDFLISIIPNYPMRSFYTNIHAAYCALTIIYIFKIICDGLQE